MFNRNRFRRSIPLALMLLVACCVLFLFGRLAHAGAGATVIAQGATDAGVDLIYQYGPLWGGMAIVFGLASSLLAKNQSEHWIAQGRTLAAIVAALGVFGAALEAHFAGTPWSGVAVTAVMAFFKLLQPTTVPVPQAPTGFPRVAPAALLFLFALGFGAAQLSSCSAPAYAGHALVDCTKADQGPIAAEAATLLAAPSWAAFENDVITALETVGGCAMFDTIDKYRPPAPAGSPVPPAPPIDKAALVARVRAHFGGVTWQTAGGAR